MNISKLILYVLLVIAVNGLVLWLSNLPQDAGPDVPEGKLSSVSFAPFREGQSPLTQVFPTTDEIEADIRMLADETRSIRTYASLGGLREVPAIARKYGVKVIQGAWIGGMTMAKENQAEIDQLIKVANEYPDVITRVIVGNEVLLRGELEPEQLLQYIRQVKRAVKQPVSYADVWSFYMRYPEIAREVDFFTVHILPYWEDEPLRIEDTAAHIENNYRKIREAFPGKPILIGESGWPSAGRQRGNAVASVVNEAKFIRSLVQLANKNGFDYNIVEAFNQPWKSKLEGVVGANWGLYSADREPVFPLTGKVTESPHWPMRLLYAGLLTLFTVGLMAKPISEYAPPRALLIITFIQVLSILLINQVGNHWYTSYSGMERFHALFIAGLSAAMALLLLRRLIDILSNKQSSEITGVLIQSLLLAFAAIALFKTQALALNGRYLSFPYSDTAIPVAGILGFLLLQYFRASVGMVTSLESCNLIGGHRFSKKWAKTASMGLFVIGIILIGIETVLVMKSANYETAYPVFTDRVYAAFMVTINYSQLLGWAVLIAAVALIVSSRLLAYALVVSALALVIGETLAFVMGHDFIESHPDLGNRIWTAFTYTIGNCQLLMWLSSILILALPFYFIDEPKIKNSII